jgi:simple sugar transport system substrate-binding protein
MKEDNFGRRISSFIVLFLTFLMSVALGLGGCGRGAKNETSDAASQEAGMGVRDTSIAVFIPGAMSGSPIYEMLAAGVKKAAAEYSAENSGKVDVTVIEGGFNQAEWEPRITALAAAGNYDLIISSNPSLPAIARTVSSKFPKQRFMLLDGELAGNPMIYTMRYNQREQAYMAGHIAALVALDLGAQLPAGQTGPGAFKRIGLVAGQDYPLMNGVILPGCQDGARAVDPEFTVDFRVVGNWFDAGKGAELAANMIRNGAAVILCVAGGANEGVVQAASEAGAKVVWFDTNGYEIRPGTVVGSSVLYQDKASYEKTMLFLKGRLPFGKAEIAGTAEGYVNFEEDDPIYAASVSAPIREKQAALTRAIRTGQINLGE